MNTMQIYAGVTRFSVCITYPVDLLHLLKAGSYIVHSIPEHGMCW